MSRSDAESSGGQSASARLRVDLQALPVLVVDDEADNLDAFRFNFRKSFRILTAQSAEQGLAILSQERVAVIVADQRMPKITGLQFLQRAKEIAPLAVPIIVTAYTDVDVLIEAINMGHIYRYVTKPWDSKEMRGVLLQALERYHLLAENARLSEQLAHYAGYLEKELHGAFDFGQLIGDSPALSAALQRVEQVARTQATVLLRGESGTGKELVAHAIHINSPRSHRPFVRVSCAALAAGVLESELFGHERGAFTGAVGRRPGRFELADGGTIFLDEIGDLPMEVQVKLLRVLQERSFERVGGSETVRVDVRVISATHQDLEAMVAAGKFREDLYYRLNVFPIFLPPLRERLEDLPALCQHFLHKWRRHAAQRVTTISPEALAYLSQYGFPGNVRELENLIERALILAQGSDITPAELEFARPPSRTATPLPRPVRPLLPGPSPEQTSEESPSRTLSDRLMDKERAEILAAIERCEGNIAQAARLLGINRSTLYYRLRKHELLHLLPTRPELLSPLP
ncbi:MAG: sigma-54-dependent Fis family transcriptional regulator [Myxococcales bacterium]|nr:sigma-54-dependent Fis family transcriptional regulator [Myxococcales bacterium]